MRTASKWCSPRSVEPYCASILIGCCYLSPRHAQHALWDNAGLEVKNVPRQGILQLYHLLCRHTHQGGPSLHHVLLVTLLCSPLLARGVRWTSGQNSP